MHFDNNVAVWHILLSAPVIKILSETSIHVEQDSALNLSCMVTGEGIYEHGQQLPKFFWFKNAQVLNLKLAT